MRMRRYGNLSGDSGVRGYGSDDDSIVIEFVAGASSPERFYRYTNESAGAETVREMQRLASAGRGLSTYVSRNSPDYESKW